MAATNMQKARAARHYVVAELLRRGIEAELGPRGGPHVRARPPGSIISVTVAGKTGSTTWQTSHTVGEERPEVRPDRLWVLVDLAPASPGFFCVPDSWMRRYVHREYTAHLARHGGRRPNTPDSPHFAIPIDEVEEWRDAWRLFDVPQEEGSGGSSLS